MLAHVCAFCDFHIVKFDEINEGTTSFSQFFVLKETVIRTAVLICLPLLPLTRTMFPLDQVLDRLVKLLM